MGPIERVGIKAGRAVLLILTLAIISVSCSREDVEVKNVVMAYNKMMTEALSKPDFRVMEFFATTEELLRIESYITYLKKDRKLMVSDLRSIDIHDDIDIEGDRAVVRTSEEWSFHYIDEKTRKPIREEDQIRYENTYHLVRKGSRWVVDRVDVKEVSQAE